MRSSQIFLFLLLIIAGASADNDIPLEFHTSSFRDPDTQRILSDKFVVRRDESSGSSEVVGNSKEVPDKFDHPSYDFMIPAGKSKKSTILAIIDFITKKRSVPPTFAIAFDEQNWFAIGEVTRADASNADVYRVALILRDASDVRVANTDGGLYKFVVEAQRGDNVLATTNVAVDVIGGFEGSGEVESSGDQIPPSHHNSPTSDELLTDESPIDGPVTILPLKDTVTGNIETDDDPELTIELQGVQNDQIFLDRTISHQGDQIRHVMVVLRSRNESVTNVEMSTNPVGVLSIRPSILGVNEGAALFVESPIGVTKTGNVEIVAKLGSGRVIRRGFRIVTSPSVDTNQRAPTELRSLEFVVAESAESGTTIGAVGDGLQIIGGDKRFSLIGSDIILTCSEFGIDRCLQDSRRVYTLMMVPRNGSHHSLVVEATILVHATNRLLRITDRVLRVSDNRIIAPVAVITNEDGVEIGGDASRFIAIRQSQHGLYQLILVNPAPAGHYTLEISLHASSAPKQLINVMVENALSHAHFRKSEYGVKIDAKMVKQGDQLVQVELEGVPIDEARIMVLDGNPGWVTVEGYGGRVKIGEYQGPIYSGISRIRIGAVEKRSGRVLTETIVEIHVENGEIAMEEGWRMERKRVIIEEIFDRESTHDFHVIVEEHATGIDPESLFAIDENGRRVSYAASDIVLAGNRVAFHAASMRNLRVVGCSVRSDSGSVSTVLVRLVSTPHYLENRRKMADRPVYPRPWSRVENEIEVEMREEMLPGQVVAVFPAIVPSTGRLAKVLVEGEMKDAFGYRQETGEIVLLNRIDYESLPADQRTFDIELISSVDRDFESRAILHISIVDTDDNSPSISGQVALIELRENVPIGSQIAELNVTDRDGSEVYRVELSGVGSEHYRANITDGGVLRIWLQTPLDRETQESQSVIIQVTDQAGNFDKQLLPIHITDINDNAPMFTNPIYELEAVENWPIGVIVGRIEAIDADLGEHLTYTIADGDSPRLVSVNSTTGEVSIASGLYGSPRSEVYVWRVIATDLGGLSGEARIEMIVRAVGEVRVETMVQFVHPTIPPIPILIKENIPKDEKIFTAKAEITGPDQARNSATVIYSIQELTQNSTSPFHIDEQSGEIFVTGPIDFEKKSEYTEIQQDVIDEIDRWFETKNMLAVACEMHWSVPRHQRTRQLECRLKEKLLSALRENNRRLLYLRGMGRGKMPVKLAESSTFENITRDTDTDSVRGIYQRSYTRLLPYLHKETPEWHSQYWMLSDFSNSSSVGGREESISPQPAPQQFLFGSEPPELLLSARNSEDESQSASIIIHVDVENVDDNSPEFLEGVATRILEIPPNTTRTTAIGRLTAYDQDGAQPIFYHLLAHCGTSATNTNFTIDEEFGEISYRPTPLGVRDERNAEICVVASAQRSPDLDAMFFDPNSRVMRKILVDFGGELVEERGGRIAGNNSVILIADTLHLVEIPLAIKSEGEFELKSLQFVPANYELGRDIISPAGAVELNRKTGELVANAKILDAPQGVYTALIGGGMGLATKQIHRIRDDRKLRYVLAMSRDEFGANVEKFKRQIYESLNSPTVRIYFDEPISDAHNSSHTSVCFYVTRDNAILDDRQTSSALSDSTNSHIAKLHHIFHVTDLTKCTNTPPPSLVADDWRVPGGNVIMIAVVAFLVLVLVALLVYVCCVSRYRRFLESKASRFRASSTTSYYKSAGYIGPPGYISPPPPAAIAFY